MEGGVYSSMKALRSIFGKACRFASALVCREKAGIDEKEGGRAGDPLDQATSGRCYLSAHAGRGRGERLDSRDRTSRRMYLCRALQAFRKSRLSDNDLVHAFSREVPRRTRGYRAGRRRLRAAGSGRMVCLQPLCVRESAGVPEPVLGPVELVVRGCGGRVLSAVSDSPRQAGRDVLRLSVFRSVSRQYPGTRSGAAAPRRERGNNPLRRCGVSGKVDCYIVQSMLREHLSDYKEPGMARKAAEECNALLEKTVNAFRIRN